MGWEGRVNHPPGVQLGPIARCTPLHTAGLQACLLSHDHCLQALSHLDLSNNRLDSHLPGSWGEMSTLAVL